MSDPKAPDLVFDIRTSRPGESVTTRVMDLPPVLDMTIASWAWEVWDAPPESKRDHEKRRKR